MLRTGHIERLSHGTMTSFQEPANASVFRARFDQSPQPMSPKAPQPRTGETGSPGAEPITVKGGKGTIEAADAHAAVAALNEVCQGTELPMLVDMATMEAVSRDARAVFSLPCAASRIALLGSGPVDRVVATFFLGVRTSPCPTRFFASRSDAMSWLAQDGAT